jgi:DNA modification methylase
MAKKAKVKPALTGVGSTPEKPVAVKVSAAKGRPMLTWVGKRPLGQVQAFPAQAVERFEAGSPSAKVDWSGWPAKYPHGGLLYHGDNKEVLIHLLANGFRGKVQLIYIDPPFDSGADYVRKVTLRGPSGTAKVDGETYTLGEQIQYQDIWANDNYLQFMYERLLLLKELMTESGSIVVHCDWNVVHLLRSVLDEIFLPHNFVNEIIWQHAVIGAGRGIYRRLPKAHETMLWYVKADSYTFETDEKDARVPYGTRITENLTKDERGYYYTRGRTGTDNPWSKDPRYLRTYVDTEKGKVVHDVWDDITTYRAQGDEYVGYPTQKPKALIRRVIALASRPGDIILDSFIGSGTTAVAAQELGRRWIGCDINKGAIQTTVKRLQTLMREQAVASATPAATQGSLIDPDPAKEAAPQPAQLSLSVWRVNDYDLQVQHNEAVGLACEYLGVERTRTDRFFDGTRGRSLVKIVPFNHPLSPVDLEVLKGELDVRKDEDRTVTFVCLGIEIAAQAAIDEWNRLRKGKHAPNRVEVIELRHDPKHGGWLDHHPAQADVRIVRQGKTTAVVTVEDFISPSIVERLRQQAGVLNPKIDDCRAMIDSVAIDPAYDGRVLNLALVDVPEGKSDLVQGTYEVEIPRGPTTVAVRITDMLGEEVLVTKSLP